ncbi:hypothetical protein [Haloferula sargassicola]|uniref:Uncharacterized protein n=1 Tax=Haloferula sargassicola TaxID=490096 RepID=A0ABP9UK46_9BACT
MTPALLEKPIRLDPKAGDLAEALAALGPCCLQTRTRSIELSTWADPAETVITAEGHLWFPSLGLELTSDRIEGVHASPLPQLPDHAGIIELDSADGLGRVGFAVGTDPATRARFHRLIGDFGLGEIENRELVEWRRSLDSGFRMCPCCLEAARKRRERPDLHPLADILIHSSQLGIELLVEFGHDAFTHSVFMTPGPVHCSGGIAVTSVDATSILRIDPLLLHALCISPRAVDGELRTVLHAFNPLGQRILTLSCPDADQLMIWQEYARTPDR